MKQYRVKVVAQVTYITDVNADNQEDAKASAIDELDDHISDSVDEIKVNWTEILVGEDL